MARKTSAQIAQRKFDHVPIGGHIIHIDRVGIYVDRVDGLEVYSHKYVLIARYTYDPPVVNNHTDQILFITSAADKSSLACASRHLIYTALDSILGCKHLSEYIGSLVYHPVRNTYFTSHIDGISEFTREIKNIWHMTSIHHGKIVPSATSANVYLSWWTALGGNLGIINSVRRLSTIQQTCIADDKSVPHTFAMRPRHPEALTMIYNRHIDVIDLWHTGGSPAISMRNVKSIYGTHLDANICILSDDTVWRVVDFRCGKVRDHDSHLILHDVWCADEKIYISNYPRLLVLD